MERRFSNPWPMNCLDVIEVKTMEKKKGGGAMLFVLWRPEPKERTDLKVLKKTKFESSWFECQYNFANFMLLNVTHYLLKPNQTDFLEEILSLFDNATCQSLPFTMTGD